MQAEQKFQWMRRTSNQNCVPADTIMYMGNEIYKSEYTQTTLQLSHVYFSTAATINNRKIKSLKPSGHQVRARLLQRAQAQQ
jgi:hypothetical protein